MYSELNSIREYWINCITSQSLEAVECKSQGKNLSRYQLLMEDCFKQFYSTLKSGRWTTVEFHNSKNTVWNALQEALQHAGFVIADVRILDKTRGGLHAMLGSTATKQDLVLSAYKPTFDFEQSVSLNGSSQNGVWNFLRLHLEKLPMPAMHTRNLESIQERMPYLLFDRMVAFHIVRGLEVPISSPEFYQGITQRYLIREGMVFTSVQASEYDALRMKADRVEQLALFVSDEQSAIQWLRQDLDINFGTGPQTYGDLMPRFMQVLHQSAHEALPEMQTILEQNFLQDDKDRWYVPDPDRQADLERLRNNALVREFSEYTRTKGRLKVFRMEAIRAGFSKCWKERDYDIIVAVGQRLPEQVLQEDASLKLYYDNAFSRASHQPRQEKLL